MMKLVGMFGISIQMLGQHREQLSDFHTILLTFCDAPNLTVHCCNVARIGADTYLSILKLFYVRRT